MKAFIYERYGLSETLRMAEVDKPVPSCSPISPGVGRRRRPIDGR
jgi:hypothetical protein